MELKVKLLKWSAGRPVAILNEQAAKDFNVFVNERLVISRGSRKIIAVIDLISTVVKGREIAVSSEISDLLRIKSGDKVTISPALYPESIDVINKKMECSTLEKSDLKKIISDITSN